jgi:hypothetical protein
MEPAGLSATWKWPKTRSPGNPPGSALILTTQMAACSRSEIRAGSASNPRSCRLREKQSAGCPCFRREAKGLPAGGLGVAGASAASPTGKLRGKLSGRCRFFVAGAHTIGGCRFW